MTEILGHYEKYKIIDSIEIHYFVYFDGTEKDPDSPDDVDDMTSVRIGFTIYCKESES